MYERKHAGEDKRVIDVDAEVIAVRNPRKEPVADFEARAQILHYQLHVADTVPAIRTNHGSAVS